MESPVLFLDDNITSEQTKTVFLACGIAMAVCAAFVVIFFLSKKAPLIFREAWKDQANKKKGIVSYIFGLILKLVKTVFLSLKNPMVLYYLAYGTLSILGIVIHPFFFSFHLTEIFIRYPNVIESVYQPRAALGLTLVLYLILNYITGLFAYTLIYDDF
mmetsp:Transcript_30987/g.28185  ORF Transcript_30987/g.28185 Transcript_30987/m.28185 type:complete len:159 (+) Transcript_30987:814-1290(+)